MKKYIAILIISLILIVPNNVFAKKTTCSKGNYKADVEIDKTTITLGEEAFISVTSTHPNIKVEYRPSIKDYVTISDAGIVKALKEGTININTKVVFDSENECSVDFEVEIVSSDSTLKSLIIKEFDISKIFKSDKYEYDITLPHKFESVNIMAIPNNSNAKVTGTGERYLNEGKNEYSIIVTASNGTHSTYKLNIIREEANNDVTLKNLIISGYVLNPKFDSNIYKYNLDVAENVKEVTINAMANYDLAQIDGTGTFPLVSGKNIFIIMVTAEDGTTQDYTIEINKNKGSSKLNSLVVEGYSFDTPFESDLYTYSITVGSDVTSLNITPKTNENNKVEIIGNENLKDGDNEIFIRVTNEAKESNTYKIIVHKLSKKLEETNNKNNNLLKILLGLFIISIIITAALIALFIQKNYKGKFNFKFKLNNKRKNKKK